MFFVVFVALSLFPSFLVFFLLSSLSLFLLFFVFVCFAVVVLDALFFHCHIFKRNDKMLGTHKDSSVGFSCLYT